MRVPLIFCTGMMRSGSTWSYNVARLLGQLAAKRADAAYFAGYLTLEQSEEFFRSNSGRVPGPTILKLHGLGPQGLHLLSAAIARAVCTYRDPRDCVASNMTFSGESFDTSCGRIYQGLQMLSHYRRDGNTLFIRYEEMMDAPEAQIWRIADHLGIEISEKIVTQINGLTSVERSKEICQGLQSQGAGLAMQNHRIDPQTWLHHNHIQSGKSGRWKEELTEDQIRTLDQTFQPWLAGLGYEQATPSMAH